MIESGPAELGLWCDRLRQIPVAVMSDTLVAAGLSDRVVACTLAPLELPARFAGPAMCFGGVEGDGQPLRAGRRLVYEADRRITDGCVAVVATGGHRVGAVIGGNTITSWRRRGCIALLTDGLVRDTEDFRGLPSFVAGVTPLANRGRWSYCSLEAPVTLPGQSAREVHVHPGDVIHGDRDGVLVIPRASLPQLVCDAEIVLAVEKHMRAAIEAGEDRERVYDRNDRFAHVRAQDGREPL